MTLSTLNYIHKALEEKVNVIKKALDVNRELERKAMRDGTDDYHALAKASGQLEDSYFEAVGVLEEFEEQEW